MDFTTRSPCIQLAPSRGGRSLPGMTFRPAGHPPARRKGQPLVSYASPEGAAWFEAMMADLLEPQTPAQPPATHATATDPQRGAEASSSRQRGRRGGRPG